MFLNWLLVILLATMAGVALWRNKGNILAPGVLVVLMFCLSTFVLAINYARWKYVVRLNTIVIIVAALLLFWIGEELARLCIKRILKKRESTCALLHASDETCLEISTRWFVLLVAISAASFVWYLLHQYKLVQSLDDNVTLLNMFGILRVATVRNPELAQLSIPMNIGISFSRAVSSICFFIFIQRLLNKEKRTWRYLIPVALSLARTLLTGGRAGMIGTVAGLIFAVYYVLQKKSGGTAEAQRKLNKTLLIYIVGGAAGFILAFWGFGFLVGHSKTMSFWDTFSVYIGSPILCFDALVNHDIAFESQHFAQYTIAGIYNILRRFVMPTIPVLQGHLEKVRWEGFSSNIYSSFGLYYIDFGVVGIFVMQVLVGFIMSTAWQLFNGIRKKSTFVIYYGGTIGYACAMYAIAERVFSNFLALNVFVEWFFAILIVWFVVEPNRKTLPRIDQIKGTACSIANKIKNITRKKTGRE